MILFGAENSIFENELHVFHHGEHESPADTFAPTIQLNEWENVFTRSRNPTFSGHASDDIGEVVAIQYKIGDIWNNCLASDGLFDEQEEEFICEIENSLADGEYRIYFRAEDNNVNLTDISNYSYFDFLFLKD
ncbi:MAG TPA: hypothetical protein PK957_04325 [Candidatus Dojkabacteria bacterium]|nr:hypothetical protein [Candidatus Dojkabacteria bacterium]HQF36410.1 hypothetical protein [Candidatus Dojkabacteria bacterium]